MNELRTERAQIMLNFADELWTLDGSTGKTVRLHEIVGNLSSSSRAQHTSSKMRYIDVSVDLTSFQ